jgi:predicted XRE-type DNA-binding protein
MEKTPMKEKKFDVTEDNIFADLGLDDAEEMLVRSDLLSEIVSIIRNSQLSQKDVAKILGISAPKISALMTGKINDFSNDTLMQYLALLGCNIEIRVIPSRLRLSQSTKRGAVTVKRRPNKRNRIRSAR